MAVPLTLSSVPAQTPYVQYIATAGQTLFPYPFEVTQDSDLVVLLNGAAQPTDSGYTLTGQGTTGGGNVIFTVGLTAGTIVTFYRNISIARITQLSQNGTFFSANFNNEYNRIYLIMQQLQQSLPGGNSAFALMVPNSNSPTPTALLTPAIYANKYLAFDANGNPTPAVLTSSGSLTAGLIASLLNGSPQTITATIDIAQTATEIAVSVTPVNLQYAPGNVLRYGADPTGVASSLTAFTNAYTVAMGGTPHTPIYIPAGTYLIPAPGLTWTNQNDIRVVGDGPNNSVLTYSGSNYTVLTISADTGAGTTGQNLNLSNFGISASAGAGVTALSVADYFGFKFESLQLYGSGNALKMAGMAVGTLNSLNCLTAGTNAAGNSALILTTDTANVGNGPLVFNGCNFNGQGNVTVGGAVWSQITASTLFNSCIFIALGPALTSVVELTNNDDITIIEGYSESSRNTTANTANLFYLGTVNAPQNLTLIGGTYFAGASGHTLNRAVYGAKVQALTITNTAFANFATSAVYYATTTASMIQLRNVYSSGSGNPPVLDSSTNGPASQYLKSWEDPWPRADVSLTAGVGSVTGDGTAYTVLFDTVNLDSTTMYSAGTGIATVSSQNAGMYDVSAAVMVNALSASYTGMEMDIVQKNGGGSVISTHAVSINPGAIRNAANQASLSQNCLLKCSAGDQIYVLVTVSGSTKSIGVVGSATEFTRMSVRFLG